MTMIRVSTQVAFLFFATAHSSLLNAQTPTPKSVKVEPRVFSTEYDELVPRTLMKLLHSEGVQQELKLDSVAIARLETFFADLDPIWIKAESIRLTKPEDSRLLMATLEAKMLNWLADKLSESQLTRLREIEYWSQDYRMLLRDAVARDIGLPSSFRRGYGKLAQATEAAKLQLEKATYTSTGASSEQMQAVADALKEEIDFVRKTITSEQSQRLAKIAGPQFDVSKLKRIYPMAPELVDVQYWINSDPIKLKDLRGKVVLLHFYASQCHNCHANFEIYNKWHDELQSKGVVVLGIQTPEIPSESDPVKVRAAAKERGLEFPIMIDLESENWHRWENKMWPTVYVIDQDGYIRHIQKGELQWQGNTYDKQVEKVVEDLLSQAG